MYAGDKDADRGGDCVRYLLATAARVHRSDRLQTRSDRIRDRLAETLLHRRLLGRPLAGHEQQLCQPNHLRLSSRLLPGLLLVCLFVTAWPLTPDLLTPFDAHCCHMGTAIKHPVPNSLWRNLRLGRESNQCV